MQASRDARAKGDQELDRITDESLKNRQKIVDKRNNAKIKGKIDTSDPYAD